jgi:hypothetical protein
LNRTDGVNAAARLAWGGALQEFAVAAGFFEQAIAVADLA